MRKKTKQRIEKINNVLAQYGSMTLRQIYYRLLPEGYNYRQIMYGCSLGRREGLISYGRIVDRSRPIYGSRLFPNFKDYLETIGDSFSLDFWVNSETRPEIWTEKDALSQILYDESRKYNVDVYVTRGFLSISNKARWGGGNATILFFGDFDPSGLYIDKDLEYEVTFQNFRRIALTKNQIQQHSLPSVPVKRSDPRASAYIVEHGARANCSKAWDNIERSITIDLEKYEGS